MTGRCSPAGGMRSEPHAGGVCRRDDGLGLRRRRLREAGPGELHGQVLASGVGRDPAEPDALPGAGSSFQISFQKVDVLCGISIKKVACGTQFSVALTKDGRVFTFGQGEVPLVLR